MNVNRLLLSAALLCSLSLVACKNTVLVDKAGRFSFEQPQNYSVVNTEGEFIQLGQSSNAETRMLVFGNTLEDISIEEMVTNIKVDMLTAENVNLGPQQSISANSYNGYSVPFQGVEAGKQVSGRMVTLSDGSKMVTMIASSEESGWNNSVASEFEATIDTVILLD